MSSNVRFCACRYLTEDTMLRFYADVLAILVRLRQLCCHPDPLRKTSSDLGVLWYPGPLLSHFIGPVI